MNRNSHSLPRARPLLVALAAAVLLTGCASQQAKQGGTDVNASQARVVPQYENDALKQQLVDLGLHHLFDEYWAAHVERDWLGRYRMEEFLRPVEEQFYVAYHQAAWQLLELRIDAVDVSDAPERVRVNLQARFRNPEQQGQERNVFLLDLWTKSGEKWRHLNSDPMLNALRPVK